MLAKLMVWMMPALLSGVGLTAVGLRTEYRVAPMGVDSAKPRLSWVVQSEGRDARQTAYQVVVTGPGGVLWDSGKVDSDETAGVEYGGAPLKSRMRCSWKVRVWDEKGVASAWSAGAGWTVGLLKKEEWGAKWVGSGMVRKEFAVAGPVRRATVYATARGVYELRLNGQRVGEQVLAPEWTNYAKRIQYQVYDVTGLVKSGANAVGAFLGKGWYAGRIGLFEGTGIYGKKPQLLMRLEVETADGRTMAVVTDESWQWYDDGPVRAADILDGETYDARKEAAGWDRAGFEGAGWKGVEAEAELGAAALVWQPNEPLQVTRELKAMAVTEPKAGVYVFDLGQNMVGWCRVRLAGKTGEAVTLRFAEMLNDDGTIYAANLRKAAQTDRYVPARDGAFEWEPRFTYHGFRYVEVSGAAARPEAGAVTGRVVHSSSPEVGRFETSSAMLNKLMQNIVWTQRANLFSTPTDCPQRDERLGWMGDIQTFSQTGMFGMDLAGFMTKWLADVRDDQAADGRFPDFAPNPNTMLKVDKFFGVPAWGDAGVIVPWRVYQNYGDKRLLAEHFDAARRWVDWIERENPNLLWEKKRHNDYGDWLNADTIVNAGWPKKGGEAPKAVFATAFFAHSTELVAKMARVLGKDEEAAHYAGLAARVKEAFRRAYVKPDGTIEGDTQAGYALALHFDLLPEEMRGQAFERMLERFKPYDGHLSTGIHSTHRLMLELVRRGRTDEAYRLLNLKTFPSWGFMIENGATTIWERWDGYVKGRGFQNAGMNSFNHWALGAVGEWMWKVIVGLAPDDAGPGWKRFTVRPRPGGGLTWAKGTYESPRGPIGVDWKIEGGRFSMKVQVPANTTARIVVPAKGGEEEHVVGSGTHEYSVEY